MDEHDRDTAGPERLRKGEFGGSSWRRRSPKKNARRSRRHCGAWLSVQARAAVDSTSSGTARPSMATVL